MVRGSGEGVIIKRAWKQFSDECIPYAQSFDDGNDLAKVHCLPWQVRMSIRCGFQSRRICFEMRISLFKQYTYSWITQPCAKGFEAFTWSLYRETSAVF